MSGRFWTVLSLASAASVPPPWQMECAAGNPVGFVDRKADQVVHERKHPDDHDIRDVAKAYFSLGFHKKGADLFTADPPPRHLDRKGGQFTAVEEAALSRYWNKQIELGTLLRQCREFKESNKVLARLLAHPNGRSQRFAEREQIHIYEEMEPPQWGTAIKLWKGHMEALQRADLKNPRVKELYFEAYYFNAVCWYRYSQTDKMKKDKKSDDYLNYAANQIIRLETSQSRDGWDLVGPRFVELLSKEPLLRLRYEQLKKK